MGKTALNRRSAGPFLVAVAMIVAFAWPPGMVKASDDALYNVYLDADLTHTRDVGEDLYLGLRAGLTEGARRFGGPNVQVLARDHQTNLRRTERTFDEAFNDPRSLAIVGGMHTPHYLRHGPTINERGQILLLPWSAGGALTRLAEEADNRIFRVSVDDSKTAPFLARQIASRGCTRVGALALDNGWGRGNSAALVREFSGLGVPVVHLNHVRFDAGREKIANEIAAMQVAEPDCVVFVLNDLLTAHATNALLDWAELPKAYTHWGVFGGDYAGAVSEAVWEQIDLAILYSCVLETGGERSEQLALALDAAAEHRPTVRALSDLSAPAAFAHAYDVGLILSAGAVQAADDPRWDGGQIARNAALRDALESLDIQVDGMLKTYTRPFSAVTAETPDGHDALGQSDLCLVSMKRDGRLEAHIRVATE